MMRSAMATGSLVSQVMTVVVLVLVLANAASGTITIQQTVENACTGDILCHCKNAGKDYGALTLVPGATTVMAVTSSLDDPDLSCDFSSAVVLALQTTKTLKVWEYIKSGFSDNPEMSCTVNGCLWKAQDDGIYYRAPDGVSFVLFIKWADVIPGVPVTGPN